LRLQQCNQLSPLPLSRHLSIFSVAYSHAIATRFAAHSSINFAVAAPVASYLLSIN